MDENKKQYTSKVATIAIASVFVSILILVVGAKVVQMNKEEVAYRLEEPAFKFSQTVPEYVGINKDQIIRVTKDGVTAYNIEGQEVWMDTLTLDKVVVKQREPYFAIGNMQDRRVHVFSDKGREAEIVTKNPIVYFSINEKGDVAIIESTSDGHIISAYNNQGVLIEGGRVTYIKSAGFPISVEVSPDSSLLMATYIDIYSPIVTSVITAIPLGKQEVEVVDNLKYGLEAKDNIIYDIEFLNPDTWVAIGDTKITFHNTSDGSLINEVNGIQLIQTPYVESRNKKGYLPVVGKSLKGQMTTYGKQTLWFFDAKGEIIKEHVFEDSITYYKADEKGVIVGCGKDYTGFDLEGNKRFTFHQTENIEDIGYLGQSLVGITRNNVYKLKRIEQEMKN